MFESLVTLRDKLLVCKTVVEVLAGSPLKKVSLAGANRVTRKTLLDKPAVAPDF
jgi:hypothetical protein